MKVITYARLKDYFDKEFLIDDAVSSVQELHAWLQRKKPDAAVVLSACRFAVNDEFVDGNFLLQQNDTIHIMPPSSGG